VQLSFALLGVLAQLLIPRADGKGRILATEVLIKNHAVANHIREGKTHQTRTIMEASRREGMITMDQRLKELYDAGLITYDDVVRNISAPAFLDQIIPPQPVGAAPAAPPPKKAFHRFGAGR
jgi:twitching motility protein PilT